MSQVFLEGFFLQASLIFALGAQNLFVLESGLRKHHHLAVSFTCFICDMTIIMMGVMGMAVLLESYPEVKIVFGILGIGFLMHYGFGKLRSKEDQFLQNDLVSRSTLGKSVLKAVTFSVINPHAYLDGIVLIGGYATKYEMMSDRIAVGMGASIYSLFWFLLLSHASSTMMPLLSNPKRMRSVMTAAGMVLLVLSFKLSLDVYGWVIEAVEADSAVVLGED